VVLAELAVLCGWFRLDGAVFRRFSQHALQSSGQLHVGISFAEHHVAVMQWQKTIAPGLDAAHSSAPETWKLRTGFGASRERGAAGTGVFEPALAFNPRRATAWGANGPTQRQKRSA